ncbi:MAG TPA: hypothetical protein VFU62_00490 [Hanamia sp.]|jgi:hypothetical protein|nr:hypothetical protein [Hanamia sp.]
MKNISLLFAPVLILGFYSCQKNINPGDPSISSKVKTYTEDVTSLNGHQVITFNLIYDDQNRLTSMTAVSSPEDYFKYHYSTGSFSMDMHTSDGSSIHEDFFLNNNQLVDSTIQYNDTEDTTTEKYTYNANKQLISLKTYDYTSATGAEVDNIENYQYDNNGNIIKMTDDYSVTTYEYYPDLLNNLTIGTPYSQITKNLVKTTVANNGGDVVTVNHTYTFDNNKRITSETDTADNGDLLVKTYTYY